MLANSHYDAPRVYMVQHRGIVADYCFANEDPSQEGDQTTSSDTKANAPESTAEAIFDITSNPGSAFGGT